MSKLNINISCHLCHSEDHSFLVSLDTKPNGEVDYTIPTDKYYREIHQCNNCGVFFNAREEDLIPNDFYEGQYNENAAITIGNLATRFNKIINLPFSNSDNKNRVLRIVNYLYQKDFKIKGMNVLDVGAGTCVFLHEMKKFGFNTNSLDPDPSSAKHSEETVKVDHAYCGTLDSVSFKQKFDLITFNKVLEHVKDPIRILKQAKELLSAEGLIYVELPDGTQIAKEQNYINRAEFFIDHHTIFNEESYTFLLKSAGFTCERVQQIVDPSGKYTIFGFLHQKAIP
jgi:2-polyprenyl-3-methyl-5-hydroxy-6-metoxy-1,4-benzoquinol methylase